MLYINQRYSFSNPKNICTIAMLTLLKVKWMFPMNLIKNHAMKTYGRWRYSSTHSQDRLNMEVSSQFHAPAYLPQQTAPVPVW
jgi:hypothetical protein